MVLWCESKNEETNYMPQLITSDQIRWLKLLSGFSFKNLKSEPYVGLKTLES